MKDEKTKLKQLVIKTYSNIASQGSCCTTPSTCCSPEINSMNLIETGKLIGYSEEELKVGLGKANLGLGCGNPVAIAELKEGETVLDLGSGAGFDAFLSAMKVGKNGHVIGVDVTPEMVAKAKENAINLKVENVDFRHGDIERLPLDDNSVDVIISNCVINLSPNKQAIFREAFRVLKPGGCLAISDILQKGEFSESIKQNEKAFSG
jgi:arsenite methyltransferase